jgi:hypothetical protein
MTKARRTERFDDRHRATISSFLPELRNINAARSPNMIAGRDDGECAVRQRPMQRVGLARIQISFLRAS